MDYQVRILKHDYDLRAFLVTTKKGEWLVVPNSIEEMHAMQKHLEAGGSPAGWEDGNGNEIVI